ncbi:MAG: UDP-N-acetylmuramoyl-L-alanine--D-glutamate ligase [Filomicrobium sp.]
MIRATTFAGKHVAVFGLGGSGLAAARSLIAGGARVVVWDDGEAGRKKAAEAGLHVVDLCEVDWSTLSSLVLAPGVPLTHPEPHWTVQLAHQHGVEIIGDIEIFARERAVHCSDAPFIAITGTNGKSTTTALISHLLQELGFDVQMGGNIGRAILTLEPPAPERIHVVEISSYQIDLTPTLKPSVGVLLNISPDHIDRHGTLENYAAVKERLLKDAVTAAVGIDDALTQAVAERLAAGASEKLYAFTSGKGARLVPRVYAIGQTLFAHEISGSYASSREIANLEGAVTLRGQHNTQNAAAALAALRALQSLADEKRVALTALRSDGRPSVFDPEGLAAGLHRFPGLPHRLEQVGTSASGVAFINDSKATNAEATEKALLSFESDIYWIVGGQAKSGGIAPLEPLFGRVAKAYLIGEASGDFATTLEGQVAFAQCRTVEAAVAQAAADAGAAATADPVVLFSPACASFDQFRNFEERGEAFRMAAQPFLSGSGEVDGGVR